MRSCLIGLLVAGSSAFASLTGVSYQSEKDRFTLFFSEKDHPLVSPILCAGPWRMVIEVPTPPDSSLPPIRSYDEGMVSEVRITPTSNNTNTRITVILAVPAGYGRRKLRFRDGSTGITFELDRDTAQGRIPLLAEPQSDSRVLAFIKPGAKAKMGRTEGAYRAAEVGGKKGWLPKKTSPPVSDLRKRIVESARRKLGKPYIWGGTGPKGYDCSGLMYACYMENGQEIPRGSGQQYRRGKRVQRKDLLPGDLVFFHTTNSGPSHVGMFIGDGRFIQSETSKAGVRYSELDEGYWNKHYLGATRWLP